MRNLNQKPNPPSDRVFGLFLLAISIIVPAIFFLKSKNNAAYISILIDVLLIVSIMARPKIISQLNKLWLQFGLLLSKISSPIILAVIYFLLLTPIALFLRLLGRDELRIHKQHKLTFWIERDQKRIDPDSFKKQF